MIRVLAVAIGGTFAQALAILDPLRPGRRHPRRKNSSHDTVAPTTKDVAH